MSEKFSRRESGMKPKHINEKELSKRIVYVVLFLILIITFFLGLYKIDSESMWEDEIYSLQNAQRGIFKTIFSDPDYMHPPVYKLFMHIWISIFGISETSLRLPSVLFGVGAVIVIFFLGKQLYDYKTGLLGGFFLGISNFIVYYMQEARPYALLLLITLLSTYLFVRFYEENNSKIGLVYAFVTILGLYTHYFMVFVVLFQNIFFLSYIKKSKVSAKHWLFIQCIIFIIFSYSLLRIIMPYMIFQNAPVISWIQTPELNSIENLFNIFSGNSSIVYLGLIFTVTILFLFLFNLYDKKLKRFIFSEEDLLLILFFFVPLITVFVISQFKPLWVPRYLIIIFPAFVLIVVRTILTLKAIVIQTAILVIFVAMNIFALNQMYFQLDKSDTRNAVIFLMNKYQLGDLIVSYWIPTLQINYYVKKDISIMYMPGINANANISKLDQEISNRHRFFVVYLEYRGIYQNMLNFLGPKIRELNESFILVNTTKFKDIRIEEYQKIFIGNELKNNEIFLPIRGFVNSNSIVNNNILEFHWTNDTSDITLMVPQNEYILNLQIQGTNPPPLKFDVLVNNMTRQIIVTDNLSLWQNSSLDIGLISNATNIIKFIFIEDAFAEFENKTIKYDRNGYVRNVYLEVKNESENLS